LDDDIMGQHSSGNDISSGDECTQLVTSGTHTINNNTTITVSMMVINNNSVNDGDNEKRIVICDEQGEGCQ
jgi:hypothetical protein